MSWNNYPIIKSNNIEFLTQNFKLNSQYAENLAYGLGRSYGDVCLNENGNIIVTSKFNKIIEIDHNNGILHCESGISIKEILKVITPMGWFLPVVAGTRNITIGGAIANDIHGKNHHRFGSFGNHIEEISLVRTNGEMITCSPKKNDKLFRTSLFDFFYRCISRCL